MCEASEYQYPVVLSQTKQVASFINIEDMLFEVFQAENDDAEIDEIALTQFVSALENTGLRRYGNDQWEDEIDKVFETFILLVSFFIAK